ncbi:MAG: hypothetical protein RIS70_1556 [Planctomycetota bacterium]|jgi:DNA modification methylase
MRWQVIQGDCIEGLKALPDAGVHCCVTSPPYFGLRDYGHEEQIGLESTPTEYVERLVSVFREVRRVLRDDGTLWLNLGDSYSAGGRGGGAKDSIQSHNIGSTTGAVFNSWSVPGFAPKNLLGIPWRVAFALQADGWYLRQDIIWHKPNPMPESVTDRCTKAHEYIFLLSKSQRYHYDAQAIAEKAECAGTIVEAYKSGKNVSGQQFRNTATGGHDVVVKDTRNKRSVWTINPQPCHEAHFAVMPEELAELCICAGCPEDGVVLDPFTGSGTTGIVALRHQRHFIGTELNADYCEMARRRIASSMPLYAVEGSVQ